jgi:hypothetical protein
MDATDPQGELIPAPAPTPPTVDELRAEQDFLYQQYQALRTLLLATLTALIVLALGVSLFIGKQMRLVRHQLEEQRPLVGKLAADYQKNSEPLIRNFVRQLQGFAAVHRDFQPVLEKYRNGLFHYFVASVPSQPAPVAPAPVPAPAAKPK